MSDKSVEAAIRQHQQYLNSPEGLQYRQTVALEKIAASAERRAPEPATTQPERSGDADMRKRAAKFLAENGCWNDEYFVTALFAAIGISKLEDA